MESENESEDEENKEDNKKPKNVKTMKVERGKTP